MSVAHGAGGTSRSRPSWLFLLSSRWLCWHAFAIVSVLGMLWLGDWQLHRAESGNELSWAYTFEWPLFALFVLIFWGKSLRDELQLRTHPAQGGHSGEAAMLPGDGPATAVGAGRADRPAGVAGAGGADGTDPGDAARAAHLAALTAEVQRYRRGRGWR
jgi:hypothetical protein